MTLLGAFGSRVVSKPNTGAPAPSGAGAFALQSLHVSVDVTSRLDDTAGMSDTAILYLAIVPDAAAAARRVERALIDRGIIESETGDSGLASPAHAPGPNVLDAVVKQPKKYLDFRELSTNGLAVENHPRPILFCDTSGDMPAVRCPACALQLGDEAIEEALGAMMDPEEPDSPSLSCAGCGHEAAAHTWRVEGEGAFGNVCIRLWNWWPLRPELEKELVALVGAPLAKVRDHI